VLEEDVENQMDGKDEKPGGMQKNRRRKDSLVHHTPKKDKVGWARDEIQQLRGKYMDGKIEGKSPRGRPRDKYLGEVKKDTGNKSHREVKELTWDRKEWRAAVN
jgi:hypothetical protein